MARPRINWSRIGSIGFIGAFFTAMAAVIVNDAQEKMAIEEVRAASSAAMDDTQYNLVNSDILEVKKDELTHLFNFGHGHVTITGKVIGKSEEFTINTTLPFAQFGEQGHIEAARARGCAIAAAAGPKLSGNADSETTADAIANAAIFLKNHCPRTQP